MVIYIGSDHGAFDAKCQLIEWLKNDQLLKEHTLVDEGTFTKESCDYPLYAMKVAKAVQQDRESFGILLCGSGIGVSIVANRFKGVRAALCRTEEDSRLTRLHNNANVLCLGGRVTSLDEIKKIVNIFLTTTFEGERHIKRLNMFQDLGE